MKKLAGFLAFVLIITTLCGVSLAQEQSVVKIMGPWVVESPEDRVLKSVVADFEKAYPQYKVELIGVPSADVNKQVVAMAASQTLPDLVITNGASNAAWKEMGIVEDISSMFTQEFLDGFYPEMLDAFRYQDELYGLPFCAAPFVLLIRSDLLEEAGLEPPQSFEKILECARKLTVDTDGDGKIDRYGMSLMGFPDTNNSLRFTLALFGANSPDVYIDENGKYATAIGSEDSLKAFELYWTLNEEELIPPGATEVDYKTMVSLLATDQVAMAISGPHSIGNIVVQNPDLAGKFIAVPFIGLETVAYLNPYGMVKFAGGNDAGAAAFLEFGSSNFVEMTRVTKRPPSRIELADVAAQKAPEIAAILDCAQYNINYLALPFRSEIDTVVYETVNAMLAGSYSSYIEAADAMQNGVQAVLDSYN